MIAPWQETQFKVVIEFKKGNSGVSRKIDLTHRKEVLPPQLQGRVTPETWAAFMTEMEALSRYHPYVVRQDIGQCCWNLQGLLCFVCIGFGMFNPDGGNYGVWTREVNDCCAHYNPTFAAGGCNAHLRTVQSAWWVEINVDPNMAVGIAALPPPPNPYDTSKPGAGVLAPTGYPPSGYASTGAPPPGYLPAAGPPPGYPQTGGYPPAGGAPAGYPPPNGAPAGGQLGYGAPPAGYPPADGKSGYGAPPAGYPPADGKSGYGAPPAGYPSAQDYNPGPAQGYQQQAPQGYGQQAPQPAAYPYPGQSDGYPQKPV